MADVRVCTTAVPAASTLVGFIMLEQTITVEKESLATAAPSTIVMSLDVTVLDVTVTAVLCVTVQLLLEGLLNVQVDGNVNLILSPLTNALINEDTVTVKDPWYPAVDAAVVIVVDGMEATLMADKIPLLV